MDERNKALAKIWESCADRMPVTCPEFIDAVSGFDVYPIRSNGEIVGGVMYKGPEVHIGAVGRYNLRKAMREIGRQILAAHGYMMTTVANEGAESFIKKMGFKLENGVYILRHLKC